MVSVEIGQGEGPPSIRGLRSGAAGILPSEIAGPRSDAPNAAHDCPHSVIRARFRKCSGRGLELDDPLAQSAPPHAFPRPSPAPRHSGRCGGRVSPRRPSARACLGREPTGTFRQDLLAGWPGQLHVKHISLSSSQRPLVSALEYLLSFQ
jgi:hypothetical protein